MNNNIHYETHHCENVQQSQGHTIHCQGNTRTNAREPTIDKINNKWLEKKKQLRGGIGGECDVCL